MIKAGVITFPGSNCDDDTVFVLEKVCELKVDRLWHKDTPDLAEFDLITLPGGFSYGDYLRCGAIASLSPIMASVKAFAEKGGLVFGICNGFQTVCEVGLLPGALAKNERLGFICRDVQLKVTSNDSPWTCDMTVGEIVTIPIAHGDGRFIVDEQAHATLAQNGQVLFTYVDNPNGSAFSIAGVCNPAKNVFGMMPHPERASDLRSRDGLKIWTSVTRYLRERKQ